MVFVESGGRGDFYFNIAHNCNVGIKKAMEYNPKWVVVSNDDMRKIDECNKLINELKNMGNSTNVIFTKEYSRNNHFFSVGTFNALGKISAKILDHLPSSFRFKFQVSFYLRQKFHIYTIPFYGRLSRFIFIHILHSNFKLYYIPGHFVIYNINFIISSGGIIYDELFINAFEDSWLGITLENNKVSLGFIDFKIDPLGGSSLGRGLLRSMRDFPSLALYNHRL